MDKPSLNELKHVGVLGMKWGKHGGGSNSKAADKQIKKEMRNAVKNRRHLSDADLTAKIGRLEKEKKLKDLTDSEINAGKKATNDIMKSAGTKVATTIISGAALYAIKYAVTKKFDPIEAASFIAPKPGKK